MKQHSAYLEYFGVHVLLEALPAQHAIVVRLAAHQSGQTQGNCARVLHHLREELREIQEGIEGVKEWASCNGKDYVLWEDLRNHPRDNPKIVASNGQHCAFADFEVFLTDVKPIHSHTMTNDPIPPEVKAELERMVTEEYKKVLRYRALKNDEINPEARQKRQQEIDLRLQNIEEIKQEFLDKIQSTDVHLSKRAIQQLVQEVVDRVVGGLGKQTVEINNYHADIIQQINKDVYKAMGELQQMITPEHETYGLLQDYAKELLDKPENFQISRFRSKLILFVRSYL